MSERQKHLPFIPTLEATSRLVSRMEKLYPDVTTRLLILVRVVKNLHDAVPESQMAKKPLQVNIPIITDPQGPAGLSEEQFINNANAVKEMISQEIENKYGCYALARQMLIFATQKELVRRGMDVYIHEGSWPDERCDHIEVSPHPIKEDFEFID